jgi:uncharacterized membrane protein YcaP (DUF421 family)
MPYSDIFHFPDWESIGLSVLQATTIFFLVIIGLQIVRRRVFAQRGPQDLIIIVHVAQACDLGLADERAAGYWGAVFSVLTLFLLGYLAERIGPVRRLLNGDPVLLYKNGEVDDVAMKKNMVDIHDLEEVAREKGYLTLEEFESMLLEGDGQISAIHSKLYRNHSHN